ncbi:MAG: hypothetical protein JNM08_18540 [Rubrivivax sp.]|nr:hypothetical protein [Rubrivivax sp.]
MPDDNDFGFALPAFDAGNALVQLKRSLRDLKLAERGNAFELRGKTVVHLAVEDGAVAARLARRLALTPEWDRQRVASGADQRKLLDEVRRRLERWQRED